MWRTRVGYAGGERPNPTYHALGDQTECFQVDYDPAVISYEDLLQLVWQSHDPTRPAFKTQYASLVLAHDDEQLDAARASAESLAKAIGRPLSTRIERLDRFWLAEDYHQKYYLRNDRALMAEFHAWYPDDRDFVQSSAAARVNGYLYGKATCAALDADLPRLGLSDSAAKHLRSGCR